MRTKGRADVAASAGALAHAVEALGSAPRRDAGPGILALFEHAAPRALAWRERLVSRPAVIPPADPLVPAIIRAVEYWSAVSHADVSIAHDQQNTLSRMRIAQLTQALRTGSPAIIDRSRTARFAGLRLVDSGSDPRIQVADILAGVARKIASDELNGHGDDELTALLAPNLDPCPIWGDDRSWSVLRPD